MKDCPRCHGSGEIGWNDSPINDPQCAQEATCNVCHGEGVVMLEGALLPTPPPRSAMFAYSDYMLPLLDAVEEALRGGFSAESISEEVNRTLDEFAPEDDGE